MSTRPDAADGDRPSAERADAGSVGSTDSDHSGGPDRLDDVDRTFGWRGWVLVALLVFSFLVGPALILVRPPALPYFFVLIVVPLLSGLALGTVAVWAAIR